MKFRISLLLVLVVVLAFGATSRVSAQDCPYSADECALLEAATANAASLTSFYMNYTITLSTSGIPDGQDIAFDLTAEGPFDASAALTVSDPMQALTGIAVANTWNASLNAGGQEIAGVFEFRIVGGELFFQGDVVTQGEWQKLDLATALTALTAQMGDLGAMTGGVDPTAAADPALLAAIMTAAEASEEPLVEYSTSEGPSIDGAATTVFTASVNVKALLQVISDEAVREQLATALQAQGQTVTAQDLAQLELIVRLFEPTLDATTLEFSQYVTNDNPNFAGFNITFNTTIDAETVNAVAQGQGTQLEESIVVDFVFDMQLSQLGESLADTVEPVEDATDLTPALTGSMGN
jgi:hypothetical protein